MVQTLRAWWRSPGRRRVRTGCYTGREHGCQYGLNGDQPKRTCDHPGVRECLQLFTREKQWINEIHLQLCRVPAPTFLEQERAAWFLEQFRAFGWDASIDRAGNVIAIARRAALRRADRAPRYRARAAQQRRYLGGCRRPLPRPRRLR